MVGDGFLASSSTELHVREGLQASADVYGVIDPTPEPATFAALGLGAVVFVKRRRRG